MLEIFSALAEYDHEHILEKTAAGQALAKTKDTPLGRPRGVDAGQLEKVCTAQTAGLSVSETVRLTGISESSVKRYRKLLATYANEVSDRK